MPLIQLPFRMPFPLLIILSANEIPQKISHIHVANLITEKEFEVFAECWHYVLFDFPVFIDIYNFASYICPIVVRLHVHRVRAIHTGEIKW